jgi:beta-hydroxyacyl-ACP dehydratase FabZ
MATVSRTKDRIDVEQIMEFLPHRYPMLLVDRIEDVIPGVSCRGIKSVTMNEPFFQGHFPGRPVMPGVLIVEAMAQAGSILPLSEPENKGKIPLIGGIENVRFRRPVVPGDRLVTNIEILWTRNSFGRFRATATVDDEVVATMEMTYKLLDREE